MTGRRAAIFFDRDGTLNESVGFVNHVDLFRVFPWTVEAVRLANRAGFATVVTTNQSGVGRGIFSEELVRRVHARLEALLAGAGARLDAIYYCPHAPSEADCGCRKPGPGMPRRAEAELGVDLARSYVVGDTEADLEMAWNIGAGAALVLTGYGRGTYERRHAWPRQPDIVAANVYAAVAEIVWRRLP